MRILLVTSMVPDPDGVGAIPKLMAAQLAGLRERHEVTLVSTFGEDRGQAEAAARLLDSDPDAHIVDRRRSPSAMRRWRVRGELAGDWLVRRQPWRVVSGAGGLQPLLDRLAAREFDVVAVEDNPVAVLRYPPGVPRVLTEHEAIRAPAESWNAAPRLRERPLRALRAYDWRRWDRFLPQTWQRFDLVQVFCESDAEAVREQAPALADRVRVNPYGMILPPACDPELEFPQTVLFTGTMAHLPNRDAAHWLAQEIMPAVRALAPEATLRIVGSSPPPEILGLAGQGIEVIADAPDMEPHLAAAAVVVAPIRSGGGMRMKVLEAMARGKAVATTPLGAEGFSSLAEELPLAIGADGNELAAAIAALLRDEAKRRELGRRARGFAERWHTPEAWARRLEDIYVEAAAQRTHPPAEAHR